MIGVVENQAPTKALTAELPVADGAVEGDPAQDVCQIALVERHRATGGVVNGFVSGFGYTGRMAMASTVAHDSHHMIVVGTSRDDMALAANRLRRGRRRHHRVDATAPRSRWSNCPSPG